MRNILRFFLCLVVAMALSACSDRLDDYYTAEELAGLRVHLQLPDYSKALVRTRALADGESISSVTVIAYDSENKFISQQTVTMTSNTITPSLPSGTATVTVVTNTTLTDEQLSSTALKDIFLTTPSATAPVCWGSASVNDLLKSSNPTISLLRMTAKATVQTASSVENFTVEGIKMYYTANSGSVAPGDAAMTEGVVTSVTNKSGETFSATSGDYAASQVFYETPAGKAFLIVKGKYNGTEGYYKVKMYDNNVTSSNTELDLLRNHNYIVTINSVNEAGYSTEDAAVAGAAENRVSVTVVDDNPPIVDMISCKDYELGVCAPLTTDGKGGTINATVVSSYQNSSKVYDYTITGQPDWVKVGTATKTDLPAAAGSEGALSSQGALCVIPITVEQNPTENARTATLTVTAGDLTRTITVTQQGYDFLSDDNRKVTFLDGTTTVSTDYFDTFLPAVQGVSAVDNQGLARDHGLHFAAVKGNTYSYKIPHLTGDNLTNNDSRITVTDGGEGNDYTVTLANSDDEDLWVSSFTITNAQGVTITYPVYHTGVLHNITEDIANAWELGTQKTGWFYYGVVEVKSSSNTYRLLDRNIGATNNGFYSPATQATAANSGATGAYLILTKEKLAKDVSEATIGKDYIPFPDYFHIPEGDANGPTDQVDEISDLPVTISTKTTADGEAYYCYVIQTTGGSEVQPAEVYLPVTGYYEGTAFRNDNHANIWSRSRLSAYQGFSADSPEYGLWFLYLDFNGNKKTVSNMRVVNGSAGRIGIGGGGKDAIYKAMPVRGIHKK